MIFLINPDESEILTTWEKLLLSQLEGGIMEIGNPFMAPEGM